MKRYKYVFFCLILFMSLALLSGCLDNILPVSRGSITVMVNLPESLTTQFVDYEINLSEITVTVSKDNTAYTQTIPAIWESYGVTFTDLMVGDWNVTARAKDVDGVEIYGGVGVGTITDSDATPVDIKLSLLPGDLELKVELQGVSAVSGSVVLYDPIDESKTITKELIIEETSGTAVFSKLRATTWSMRVELYDSIGELMYTGQGFVDVLPGRTTYAQAVTTSDAGIKIGFHWNFPPLAPAGMTGYRRGTNVALSWNPNSEDNVYGYLIYRSESATGVKTLLNMLATQDTNFEDTTAENGISYWYWVQAFDTNGLCSDLSEPFVMEVNPIYNRIVYQSVTDSTECIMSMNLDGSNANVLADEYVRNTSPLISPDHSKILYWHVALYDYHLMTMNIDGTDKREIELPISIGYGHSASWSSDGTQILLANSNNIYTLNPDGSNFTKLIEYSQEEVISNPVWSPTADQILYRLTDYYDFSQLWIYDLNTQETHQVVEVSDMWSEIRWSSDGTKIYYLDYTANVYELYAINCDGTDKTALYTSTDRLLYYKLSPDNTTFVVVTTSHVVLVPLDGSSPQILLENKVEECAWTLDSSHIILSYEFDQKNEIYDLVMINKNGSGFVRLTNMQDVYFYASQCYLNVF